MWIVYGWHNRNIFLEDEINYLKIFLWDETVLIEIYPKMNFSGFLRIVFSRAKILDIFSDKSSILGNRFVPIKRSTHFLSILMVFGLPKNPDLSQ